MEIGGEKMNHTWEMGPDGRWMPVYTVSEMDDKTEDRGNTTGTPVEQEGYTVMGAVVGLALTFFLVMAPLMILLLPFILLAGCLVLL